MRHSASMCIRYKISFTGCSGAAWFLAWIDTYLSFTSTFKRYVDDNLKNKTSFYLVYNFPHRSKSSIVPSLVVKLLSGFYELPYIPVIYYCRFERVRCAVTQWSWSESSGCSQGKMGYWVLRKNISTPCVLGMWLWFKWVIFKCVLVVILMSMSNAIIAFMWMAQGPSYDKSTLVHVMAWCR